MLLGQIQSGDGDPVVGNFICLLRNKKRGTRNDLLKNGLWFWMILEWQKKTDKFCVIFRKSGTLVLCGFGQNRTLLSHLCRTEKNKKKAKHLRSNCWPKKSPTRPRIRGKSVAMWCFFCWWKESGGAPVEVGRKKSHYLQGLIHLRLFGISEPSTAGWCQVCSRL